MLYSSVKSIAFVALLLKNKKISNDQELIQSDPTSCPALKTKRETTKYIN